MDLRVPRPNQRLSVSWVVRGLAIDKRPCASRVPDEPFIALKPCLPLTSEHGMAGDPA